MPIHLLDDQVIAHIAAGEVIERPASVVKELTENALDAGARNVHVSTEGAGKRSIRVSDDGSGIASNEVMLAFTRHATSKLQRSEDLTAIHTLGFRGEALASIASVSRVTLLTRQITETTGARLRIDGGQIITHEQVGTPAGTILTIEHLFFNTPARLKFLKQDATEKRHIAQVVTQYALAYPSVRFTLEQDGREVFRTPGSGLLADVLVQTHGLDTFKHMVEIDLRHKGIDVYGYVSTPTLSRKDRGRLSVFVNGRAVQDSRLSYALTQAYRGMLPDGRSPIAALSIALPVEEVDVNVHPAKAEVRFRDPSLVFEAIQRAVRTALLGLDHRTQPPPPSGPAAYTGTDALMYPTNRHAALGSANSSSRSRPVWEPAPDPSEIPVGMGTPQRPRTLPVLRIIGQISATYIIAEGPAGMYLIDQHAAHTAVLHDEIVAMLSNSETLPTQPCQPNNIEVTQRQQRLLDQHAESLRRLGYDVEAFGPRSVTLRSMPQVTVGQDPSALINALLLMLERCGDTPCEDALLLFTARQAAVKAGQIMEADAMQALVSKLERCPAPLHTPDGQPTLLHMSGDEIAREFRRSDG